MSESAIDKELEAIKTIAGVLGALDANAQTRVLSYAMQHLRISPPGIVLQGPEGGPETARRDTEGPQTESGARPKVLDIRTLKEEKAPQSDVQMAALVAYYLAEMAPDERRKEAISTRDIVAYFKQAGYELPKYPKDTLPHAKGAGYLDNAGRGKYKLNPVGHNLVVHKLPAPIGDKRPRNLRTKATAKRAHKSPAGATPGSPE